MIDFVSPLGRPPLDTYSPTQVVRTATPMAPGFWELEGGSAIPWPGSPLVRLRTGVMTGMDLEAGTTGAARRSLAVRFAPIPGLLSFDAGTDFVPFVPNFELGSTLEIALPHLTPRIASRLAYDTVGGAAVWRPRLDLGLEFPILTPALVGGADVDLGFDDPATRRMGLDDAGKLNLGFRFRAVANLGGSVFGSWAWSTNTVTGGALAALRF